MAELILHSLVSSLQAVLDQRKLLATDCWSPTLFQSPDVHAGDLRQDRRRIRIDVGDGSSFPSAAHLAASGLAPVTRSSGSSIRGGQPSRRGNKQLKRAFYYDKKIKQGKHHTQALLYRARRRADVLFAMLRDGTFYEPRPATSA